MKLVPTSRKLLIFDLDETLFFATAVRLPQPESFRLGPYFVYKRPHVGEFLTFCAAHFDLAVWTASSEDYAVGAVAEVFGPETPLQFLWARSRCTYRTDQETRESYWVKDLRKIRKLGYHLERVLVIDDTARKHERNYGNLIQVRAFEGESHDDELALLWRYLETLVDVENVRTVEKRGWRNRALERGT